MDVKRAIECVSVRKGNIFENIDKCAAFANTTNFGFHKRRGGMDYHVYDIGGEKLQDECKRKGKGIHYGDAFLTGAYGLNRCGYLYVLHTVCPEKNHRYKLKDCFANILKEAEINRVESIAIPAIGTGNKGYSSVEVSRVAIDTVINYLMLRDYSSIKKVVFVIRDESVAKDFRKELEHYRSGVDMPIKTSEKNDVSYDKDHRLTVFYGDIFENKYGFKAIVNTTNKNFSPSEGEINKQIFKLCGPDIYGKRLSNGICPDGEAVLVDVGEDSNLKYRYVIHTVCPMCVGNEKITNAKLIECYENILKIAEENNIESISIPVIGVGRKLYDPKDAAKVAVGTVVKHLMEYSDTYIKYIAFITNDHNIMNYYDAELKAYENVIPELIKKDSAQKVEQEKVEIPDERIKIEVDLANDFNLWIRSEDGKTRYYVPDKDRNYWLEFDSSSSDLVHEGRFGELSFPEVEDGELFKKRIIGEFGIGLEGTSSIIFYKGNDSVFNILTNMYFSEGDRIKIIRIL